MIVIALTILLGPLPQIFTMPSTGHSTLQKVRPPRGSKRSPTLTPNTGTEEFSLRDPDGYYVTFNAISAESLT